MTADSREEDLKNVDESCALYEELRREVELLGKAERSGTQTRFPDPVNLSGIERRLLVRSIFSFVEAFSYSLKTLALDSRASFSLGPGERMLAVEETCELSTSGRVETRRAKLHTLGNVRFAFDIAARSEGADFHLDVSHRGWQLLQHSIKVRDRLMHPKVSSDLHVSDEEIRNALFAFIWFESQAVKLLLMIISSLRGRARTLEAEVTELKSTSEDYFG
jgi:hypothetical protein